MKIFRVKHPQGNLTYGDGVAGIGLGGALPTWWVDGIAYVTEGNPWLNHYRQAGDYEITEVDSIPAEYVTSSARLAGRPEHTLGPRPGRSKE